MSGFFVINFIVIIKFLSKEIFPIVRNCLKKCKKPDVQKAGQSSEILSKIATENTTTVNNNTLDEEFRNDLNSIINKLLVKSNMVRLIFNIVKMAFLRVP